MQRRSFLAGIAGAAIAARAAQAQGRNMQSSGWDLVIVGAGTAGLPAAIFAARRGGRVLLIDAADSVGGTLHIANGQVAAGGTKLQAAKGIADSPDLHFADIMNLSAGKADAAIARLTAIHGPATLDWILDSGLMPLPDHPVTGDSPGRPAYTVPRYFWGADAGRALLAAIAPQIEPEIAAGRIALQLSTRATALLTDSAGAVIGVACEKDGQALEFRGRHVLLATGGYAMNPALFQTLTGHPAYASGSWAHNHGAGLEMASAIGAALRGQALHRAGTGSILTAETFPAKVYARFNTTPQERLPWEIWVNNRGERFIREDEPQTNERARALIDQPALRYAIVFDEAILAAAPPGIARWPQEKLREHFNTHPMFHRADSLDALAQRAGIDAAGLARTVAAYNQSVASGGDSLGRTHMPRPIGEGPFYAIIHLGHSATSSTGLVVDADLRVLRADGAAIPNLYAAGEVLGSGATLGDAFVPGMMLTPALTLGRRLGQTLPLG